MAKIQEQVEMGQSVIVQYEDGKEITIAPVKLTGGAATLEIDYGEGVKRVLFGKTEHKRPESKPREAKPATAPTGRK